MQWAQVRSLVRELRSHMQNKQTNKQKKPPQVIFKYAVRVNNTDVVQKSYHQHEEQHELTLYWVLQV